MSISRPSLSLLRLKNFRLLMLTRGFTTMALQAQAVIVGWQIYSITKSPLLLGLTGLVEAVPAIIGALAAGHIVDTRNPRTVYRLCLGALLLNTLILAAVGSGYTPISDANLLPWIFGGVFLSGLIRSFIGPSTFTLVSRIVVRSEQPAAAAWLSSTFQVSAITGPAVAGLIYGGYGASGAWMIPSLLMILAFAMVNILQAPQRVATGEKREPALKSIRAGWRFIWKHPVLLSIMSLDMFAVLFGGATAMLPVYADQILHVGSEGLGALRAAPALGAICMSLFLAINPLKSLSARQLLYAVTGFGFCMIGFGLSTSFAFSMMFLALSGAFDGISMIMRSTLVQVLTPDAMRGRVSSINSMFIISSNEIGAFESGAAARLFGLVPSVVAGGICTLMVVGVIALASPKFRKTVVEI